MEKLNNTKIFRDLCNCTEIVNKKCTICKKDLGFIETPFGSVPTIYLFNKYLDEFNKLINKQIKLLNEEKNNQINYLEQEFGNKVEKITLFSAEKQKEIEEKIINFAGKAEELLLKLQKELNGKTKEFSSEIQEKLTQSEKERKELKSLLRKNMNFFKISLILLSDTFESLFEVNKSIIKEQSDFQNHLLPNFKKLMDKLEIINSILPNQDLLTLNSISTNSNEFYEQNHRFLSQHEIKIKIDSFLDELNELPKKYLFEENIFSNNSNRRPEN